MKKFLLFILIAVLSEYVHADFSIDWMRTPSYPAGMGTSIARDANDNVYTATSTGDIYLGKRDKFGNLLWYSHSFTTIAFNYEYPAQVHADNQGNPVVVGYRHTTSSSGRNANALIVLKYDVQGTLLFKLVIDGTFSYFNNSQWWTKVTSQLDSSGNIYIGTAGDITGQPQQGFNVVKISPSGTIIRVSTKNFSSATGFHFVSQTRLSGNMIGVTGVTDYSSANATTWMIDTAGNDLWNAVTPGIQGKDLAFDGIGNTFMLTWVSPSFSGDVALYKFDYAGNQLWVKTYDFGGSDLAARMERTPDGNLAIMAYANTAPNGSYYVDWVTFKTDTAGTLLWNDRYDEHGSNDEIPHMMAVDLSGNIYVSGIAGPFPGGNNLGKRQMVTVKYSPAGIREWASTIDTINEYLTGVGIAIAGDSSLFVVGDLNTFTIHYLDHTGSDPCVIPSNVTVSSVSDTTSTISWSSVPNAYLYHVRYKTAASITWESASTNQTSHTLTSLFSGMTYDFQVEAICNSGPTGYSALQQFTTTGTSYCPSAGLDASQEWIDLVYIETLLNSTPDSDSGYADYTHLSVDLLAGNVYDITLSADMPFAHMLWWKVWIDFNRNGDFADAGEEVVSYSSSQVGWETSTFSVPFNAVPGTTVMRVSSKNGSAPTPCEVFGFGEVEDYTVNLLSAVAVNDVTINEPLMQVIPQHVSGNYSVHCSGLKGTHYTMLVSDIMGKELIAKEGIIMLGRMQQDFNAANLPSGIYFVILQTESNDVVKRILITR